MTTPFQTKIQQFMTDADVAHQIIHGDNTTSVETEGGLVDSFAKVMKDNTDAFNASQAALYAARDAAAASASLATDQASAAQNSSTQALSAANAALQSRGLFPTTADALSNGVVGTTTLVAGSGGTNGTFDLIFTGGGGSGATGRFTVVGGALTGIVITSPGSNYTSAPTLSFTNSTGLIGASAVAVIGVNVQPGQYFLTPVLSGSTSYNVYQNVSGTATLVGSISQGSYDRRLYQILRERFRETDLFAIRNWIAELSTAAADFQITFTGGAVRNADGTWTIPAGGSIKWDLGAHFGGRAPYGPWAAPSGNGNLVPGPGSSRYFAVFQPDISVTGLSFNVLTYGPPSPQTWTQTAPGLWEGVYVVENVNTLDIRLVVTNNGSSPITILTPYAGLTTFGLLEDYKQYAPAPQLPQRDWKFQFPSSPAGDRAWIERQSSYFLNSVTGSDSNNGTDPYTPKATFTPLPALTKNQSVGLWRGSLHREDPRNGGQSEGGTSPTGIAIRDVRQGRSSGPLPIISALAPVSNGSFVSNGDGTYSYTWTPPETLLDDGYSNVFIVEVNTATEAEALNPISSANRMPKTEDKATCIATAGTSFLEVVNSTTWKITIHPTDGLAPGSGTYRYEVVNRFSTCDWFQYGRDGYMSGIRLQCGSHGYGALAGPNYFEGDRLVIQHATTHGAVVGSGKLTRSIIYGASDSPSGNIGWTWYAAVTAGTYNHIRYCYFSNARQAAVYSHNSGGGNAVESIIEDCVLDAGLNPVSGTVLTGQATGGFNCDTYIFRNNYVLGGYYIGCGAQPTYDLYMEHNIFRDVAIGLNLTWYGNNRYFIRNNIFAMRSWSNPGDVGQRGVVFGNTIPTQASSSLFVEHNLVHVKSTAGTLDSEDNVVFCRSPRGSWQYNIVILDMFDTTRANISPVYLNWDVAAHPNYGTSDYNLIVSNCPLGKMLFNPNLSQGGGAAVNWDAYKAISGMDAHSLFIDVSNDPRGIQAVFVDPVNGDYRFAHTEQGRRAGEYCKANGVGPDTVISKWPEIPTVDEAYRMLERL
jgi:hypothetical protein